MVGLASHVRLCELIGLILVEGRAGGFADLLQPDFAERIGDKGAGRLFHIGIEFGGEANSLPFVAGQGKSWIAEEAIDTLSPDATTLPGNLPVEAVAGIGQHLFIPRVPIGRCPPAVAHAFNDKGDIDGVQVTVMGTPRFKCIVVEGYGKGRIGTVRFAGCLEWRLVPDVGVDFQVPGIEIEKVGSRNDGERDELVQFAGIEQFPERLTVIGQAGIHGQAMLGGGGADIAEIRLQFGIVHGAASCGVREYRHSAALLQKSNQHPSRTNAGGAGVAWPGLAHRRFPCDNPGPTKNRMPGAGIVVFILEVRVSRRGRPEDHVTSVKKPDDFDAFWQDILQELDAIPLDPHLEPVPMRSTDEVEVFEIHYTSLDHVRIAGWYCRPREGTVDGPYPGLSLVPGYVSEPTFPKSWAKAGYAAIGVAPRGKLRSNRQFNPGYPGLLTHNITDRNTYSYRGFYCDALRAIDFLLTRPEIDPTRIGVHGSSQGGALSLVTAAMRREHIAAAALGAPYLVGYMDSAKLTHSYPYEEINEYLRLYPDREQQVRDTLDYFDCLNLAPDITCPTLIYAGLNDDVCPPETAFDLVKVMHPDVVFHTHERCGHDAGNYWEMAEVEAFLAKYLKPVPVTAGSRAQMTVG